MKFNYKECLPEYFNENKSLNYLKSSRLTFETKTIRKP